MMPPKFAVANCQGCDRVHTQAQGLEIRVLSEVMLNGWADAQRAKFAPPRRLESSQGLGWPAPNGRNAGSVQEL